MLLLTLSASSNTALIILISFRLVDNPESRIGKNCIRNKLKGETKQTSNWGVKQFGQFFFKHECALKSTRQSDTSGERHFPAEGRNLVENPAKNLLSWMVPEVALKVGFNLLSYTRNVKGNRTLEADIFDKNIISKD